MTINCRGTLIDFETPKIMGILNLTPDSFYDGGRYKSDQKILSQVEKMLEEGADFIDIGGQSTRSTSTLLSPSEEADRVVPLLKMISREFPKALFSVDTFYSKVAEQVIQEGAVMINDISGATMDPDILKVVGDLQVPYVLMHMRGTPQTMQDEENLIYKNLINDINFYFSQKISRAREFGITDLIIDPGFGFSKTSAQNLQLIKSLYAFKYFDLPILMGVSRKSTICKILSVDPENALNGTTVLNTLSLLNGANLLRVHDVKEARECIKLIADYK